jgi:Sulfite exporter TauE/SafE.
MIVGSVVGGGVLSVLPPTVFEYLLGGAIVLISFWFLLGNSDPGTDRAGPPDLGVLGGFVGVFSGFCGGFTGMGGPPLIVYLGERFDKELFRAVIVPIFLMAAVSRFSTYTYLGMVEPSSVWLYVLPPVGVIAGNYVGDRFFQRVEQKWFTVIIGVVLLASGVRLILG